MKPITTRIVAAVVDTTQLTMYTEKGDQIVIPQGDPRLRRIIEQATPQLVAQGWVDVVIDEEPDNSYDDFQKKSTGIVRFFKVAKEKLKNLFTPVQEMVLGTVPKVVHTNLTDAISDAEANVAAFNQGIADAEKVMIIPPPPPTVQSEDGDHVPDAVLIKHEQTMAAVNEILQHAVPVSSETFHERDVMKQGRITENDGKTISKHAEGDEPETIIAVVDNKVIPGMEKIKSQFARAAKLGNTVGVENFLKRLAAVIDNRGHSVEDLLKFLERADLPIADDGTILIYKVLKRKNEQYVDCHSKKVEQFVGAYVCMDPKLVDPSRTRDCSNGLHVARRGYLSGFSGDVCVLAKLAPEDVIAVPEYDANKMRVCGYHIIAELSREHYNALNSNKPITYDEAGKQLLAKAMRGDHIRRTHEVRITGAMGAGVTVTKLEKKTKPITMAGVPAQLISDAAEASEVIGDDELEAFNDQNPTHWPQPEAKKIEPVTAVEALQNPAAEALDQPIDPKQVVKQVEKAVENVALSRKEQAKILYDALAGGGQEALDAIHAFKKASKVSWEKLGLPDIKGSIISARPAKPTPQLFEKPKPTPDIFDVKKSVAKGELVRTKKPKPTSQVHDVDFGDEPKDRTSVIDKPAKQSEEVTLLESMIGDSPRERIKKLLAIGLGSEGIAQSILDIKKKSKKSWEVLGVDAASILIITNKTGSK